MKRRGFIKITACAIAAHVLQGCATGLFSSRENCQKYYPAPDNTYPSRTIDLVNSSLVIDMAVSLVNCAYSWNDPPYEMTQQAVDFLASSGISVFHLAPGLPRKEPNQHALEYINRVNSIIDNNPEYLTRIDGADDFDALKRNSKLGFMIGFQNSTHFRKLEDVDDFWKRGQRVSQITQNERNLLGSGAMVQVDKGLTAYGADIIHRMNRVGIAVDVAHCGDLTTLDAIAASSKPVLITHANCRALNPGYMRDKTDEAIKKMAATGGVMGLTGLRAFVRGEEPTTIEHFLDHVDHIAGLAGIEHVGIGSDQDIAPNASDTGKNSDYYRSLPEHIRDLYKFRDKSIVDGLNKVHRIYAITDGLIRRGYSDDDIRGVLGLNFKRALDEAWS